MSAKKKRLLALFALGALFIWLFAPAVSSVVCKKDSSAFLSDVELCTSAVTVRLQVVCVYLVFLAFLFLLSLELKLLFFGLLLPFVVLEIGLRGYDFYLSKHYKWSAEHVLWQYDSVLGWKNSVGESATFGSKRNRFMTSIKINSKGLRDEEYSYKKETGLKRVLLLGDSVIAGFEVGREEVIDTFIEKGFSSQGKIEAINSGTRGWGTDQALLFFKKEGFKYQPDVVVYFFVDNDPVNNLTIHRPRRKFGKSYFVVDEKGKLKLSGVPVPKEFEPFYSWKMSDKRVEAYSNENLEDGRRDKVVDTFFGQIDSDFSLFHSYLFLKERFEFLFKGAEFGLNDLSKEPEFVRKALWGITERLIVEMRDRAEELGAKFFVFQTSTGDPKPGYLPELSKICSKHNIGLLDSTSHFYELAQSDVAVRFLHDGHWNKRGHEEAAKLVVDYILENKLL